MLISRCCKSLVDALGNDYYCFKCGRWTDAIVGNDFSVEDCKTINYSEEKDHNKD